jgi:hypothetical protein
MKMHTFLRLCHKDREQDPARRAALAFVMWAKRGGGSGRSTASPTKFRRLTRDEAAARGVSYSAKRQVDINIKNVTASSPIYTQRQAEKIRLGSAKEKYTADIKARRRFYSEVTRKRQVNVKNSGDIRRHLPDIAIKDKRVALKKMASGYHSLTPAERERFQNMFRRYPIDDVRQALGSAPRDIGRFGIAA